MHFSKNFAAAAAIATFAIPVVAMPQWGGRGGPPAGSNPWGGKPATSAATATATSTTSAAVVAPAPASSHGHNTATSAPASATGRATAGPAPASSAQASASSAAAPAPSSGGGGGSGHAIIQNKCTFPIYMVDVPEEGALPSVTIEAGKSWSQQYISTVNDGVSLKVSTSPGSGDISQWEYTRDGSDSNVSFDVSDVNGNPFSQWGFTMISCKGTAACPPPSKDCPGVYTDPTNGASPECPITSDITVVYCQA